MCYCSNSSSSVLCLCTLCWLVTELSRHCQCFISFCLFSCFHFICTLLPYDKHAQILPSCYSLLYVCLWSVFSLFACEGLDSQLSDCDCFLWLYIVKLTHNLCFPTVCDHFLWLYKELDKSFGLTMIESQQQMKDCIFEVHSICTKCVKYVLFSSVGLPTTEHGTMYLIEWICCSKNLTKKRKALQLW